MHLLAVGLWVLKHFPEAPQQVVFIEQSPQAHANLQKIITHLIALS